jgi:preprotein translocase subunit SecB
MSDAAKPTQPEFLIHRVYARDISFESPHRPFVFQDQQWHPEVNVELSTETMPMDEHVYEVTLTVTATVKSGEKTAFLAEVKQAGVFTLRHFSDEQMGPMLGSFCPNILFPYAREAISDMVNRGGFPQLLLAPVNFDALYAQHTAKQPANPANTESAAS